VIKGRKLNIEVENLADLGNPVASLLVAKELMDIQDKIHSSLISKANIRFKAFQISVLSSKTLPQARKHIQHVHDLYASVCPYSNEKYERLMKNFKLDENYLRLG
jgi:hypothetical protein